MTPESATDRCPGCGVWVPASDGPVHPYMQTAPGCWTRYGEVLAREYGEFRHPPVHRLTIDSYAVQHPRGVTPSGDRSVAVHLAGLQLVLECGYTFAQATDSLSVLLRTTDVLPRFDPPEFLGEITVHDVRTAGDYNEHIDLVNRWAESTWSAWSAQHAMVHRWVDRALLAHGAGSPGEEAPPAILMP